MHTIERIARFHLEFEGIQPFIDAHVIIRTKLEKPSKINGLHYFSPCFFCACRISIIIKSHGNQSASKCSCNIAMNISAGLENI